ncbi:methyltransferase domain-containing protein [Clostridium sp.]|uniref:class I SAM-dependent methyltransferase n=1 Tax=Clostridium sp. TaxID=1506 RepID=UPI003217033C
MNNQSEINKKAWNQNAYKAWVTCIGEPSIVAKDMINNPQTYLRRYLEFLGDVREKKIVNLLGSSGKKAIPLSILGAEVTVVDISDDNKRYATEVANSAKVDLNYIVSDFIELDIENMRQSFDIAFLEGGILHYFSDLNVFAGKIYELLKFGGKLVLNDFHPIRKIFKCRNIFDESADALEITGDYFQSELEVGDVAYKNILNSIGEEDTLDCLLRYYTMGEIITSFAAVGFVIEKLVEGPRFDSHKNIPGDFTLVASKLKVDR